MDFGKVSFMSMICMGITCILSILLLVGPAVYLRIKRRLNLKALLYGALFFTVFALVLENAMDTMLTKKSLVPQWPYLFMLYAGLMPGIFEESARFIAFKFALKVKKGENINTGISYGIGHGGIEAVLLVGLTSIFSIINSISINTGIMSKNLGSMSAAQAENTIQALNRLIEPPSYMFLIGGFERVLAMVVQVSLSLIVFKAITNRKWELFAVAVALHAIADFPAALYYIGIIRSVYLVEAALLVCAALYAAFAYMLYRKDKDTEMRIETSQ